MKITTRLLPVALVAVLFGLSATANAQMNYQGRLTDGAGAVRAAGPTKLTFSVYNAATGGTKLWGDYVMDGVGGVGRGPKADVIADGRFNVIIGATDTLSRTLTTAIAAAGTTSLFLEIKVENEAAISPRQQILATPRALFADTVAHLTSTTAGNIGIGTTPDSKLHVNGSGAAPALKVDVNGSSKLLVNTNGGVSVGTSAAATTNSLLVAGTVTSSGSITENGLQVPSGQENLRIVRGNINEDGTVASVRVGGANGGPGYTSSYTAAGEIYTITFSPAFSGVPSLTGSCWVPQDDNFVSILTLTATGCTLILRDNDDSDTRMPGPFSFIAIGPP